MLWICNLYSAKMSNGQPPQRDDSSSLRDRIVDILSPGSPSRRLSTDHNHGPSHGASEDHYHDGLNETSRLLEDYDRRHSVCGLPDCNHGTFSPKPEQQEPSSLAGSYLWGTRNPRFIPSGLQTPATDGTSVTNRLVAEMGLKNSRRMYAFITPRSRESLAEFMELIICVGTSLTTFPLSTGSPNTDGSFSGAI